MVKIWHMDNDTMTDSRLPHSLFPPKYMTPEKLKKRTGVFLWKIGLDSSNSSKAGNEGAITQMEWINREHKFVMDDIVEIKDGVTPRFTEKLQEWYQPHVHKTEEARLVLEGQGYYDIEDCRTGKWLRIMMEKGDFIVVPAGCLHRFTTDMNNHIKLKRFYQTVEGEPFAVSQINCLQLQQRNEYLSQYNPSGLEAAPDIKKGYEIYHKDFIGSQG